MPSQSREEPFGFVQPASAADTRRPDERSSRSSGAAPWRFLELLHRLFGRPSATSACARRRRMDTSLGPPIASSSAMSTAASRLPQSQLDDQRQGLQRCSGFYCGDEACRRRHGRRGVAFGRFEPPIEHPPVKAGPCDIGSRRSAARRPAGRLPPPSPRGDGIMGFPRGLCSAEPSVTSRESRGSIHTENRMR